MAQLKYQSEKERLQNKPLTKRELEICYLLSQDFTRKAVCERLFISKNTVDNHMRRIHARTGLKTSWGIIALLIRQGKI